MRERGFTLVEILVATLVSTIVVLGAVVLLRGSQRMFETGKDDRDIQETARVALAEIGRHLRTAGYGLEPTFVFDFGQANTVMDRIPAGNQARFGGYACATPATCRDSITGPDELVFYARDPTFERELVGAPGANWITLSGAASLSAGQVLQVMCYGVANQWLWAYVTVSTVDASNPTQPKVFLAANTGLPYDFPNQNATLAEPCFASGTRRAFKIDRFRYYVASVDANGAVQPWGTAGTRPYLMLDQGLTDATGPILSVVAPDVEDLQVAYVFPLAPSGSQLAGATSGTAVDASDSGIDLAPALGIPTFATPALDPIRTTHHPANIRAVRLALTVRAPRTDIAVSDATVPAALNRPAVAGEAGFRRIVVESSTYTRNLEARAPVFPTYDPTYASSSCAGTAGNCGGG